MHVMFATSEAAPYSKTGGLADVCSALPKALAGLGIKASIVTPLHKSVREHFLHTNERLEALYGVTLNVPIGGEMKRAGVQRAQLPGTNVDVYFIEHNDYFNRDGLYNRDGADYRDNSERFAFFSRATLELIRELNLEVDVLHANDWQTGLIPAYLDSIYQSRSRFESNSLFGGSTRPRITEARSELFDRIKTVITIHNLRHQGRFWKGEFELTGLDWSLFSYDKMEFYGQMNYLKTGIVFSDAVTTVSPRYAEEIQSEEFGEKLQGVLQLRANDLVGILNGIDVDEWNPKTDAEIAANYDAETYETGKAACKAALQRESNLPLDPRAPLFGVVSRFDPQKGLNLVADVAPSLVERDGAQLVILGCGDHALAERFDALERRYPNNVSVFNGFSPRLAHVVEAGIDMFLMPSCYEPCGLNQMYSLRYGSLPIARDVGGLHDTVVNASDENIAAGDANGFLFYWDDPEDLRKALDWALHCWRDRKDDWKKMVRTAMTTDFSWTRSAEKYALLYESLTERR